MAITSATIWWRSRISVKADSCKMRYDEIEIEMRSDSDRFFDNPVRAN
jgi:hypothetical protein